MATSLVTRASATNQNLSLFRLSFNFLKSFSTSSSSANATPNSSASKKPKKKKKNLFEVAQFLPNWGIGYHMAKSHWKGVSYEITKINLYKDGRHGKAWGIAHKEGLPAADAPKKISGVHKRCWKYIPSLSKLSGSKLSSSNSTETAQKSETQAA
ncbi:uncharacterized protein [Euphorbia lathyris]|uniref:uncharacterized protein n=1 Tax=Euphorbia lathyris TaxID=212925 RepID=UPI0033140333